MSNFCMSNRRFYIFISVVVLLGVTAGYALAGLSNLQSYKLVNIIGLLFDFLAVFVLSEALVSNANWKRVCVEWIAPALLWMISTIPLGAGMGVGLAWLLGRGHSASTVGAFSISAYLYSVIVGTLLEQTVVFPRLLTVVLPRTFTKEIETRWRYFGLILLGTGILLQLVSAISGL